MQMHWANLHTRPVEGEQFLAKYPAGNYSHRKHAHGGDDSASFKIRVNQDEAEWLVERVLGGGVNIFADDPYNPCWEGYVNRITYNMGTLSFTISLDEMVNRVSGTVTHPASSATNPTQLTVVDTVDSQDVYGIKEGSFDAGYLEGASVARPNTLLQTIATKRAFPQKSFSLSVDPGEQGIMKLECLGWYHVLEWVKWLNGSALLSQNQVHMANMLAAYPNTTFLDTADTSYIDTNAAFTSPPAERRGATYWQFFQQLTEAGDGTNQWVMGIQHSVYSAQRRRTFYYRQANTQLKYLFRSSTGRVLDVSGNPVAPWDVTPDSIVAIMDYLGYSRYGTGEVPTEQYYSMVEYAADTGRVKLTGSDNISPEAIFHTREYYKQIGRKFGPPLRTTYT